MSDEQQLPARDGRNDPVAENIARMFHLTYEGVANTLGYETRRESRVSWECVPELNRRVMVQTVRDLLDVEVIRHG